MPTTWGYGSSDSSPITAWGYGASWVGVFKNIVTFLVKIPSVIFAVKGEK